MKKRDANKESPSTLDCNYDWEKDEYLKNNYRKWNPQRTDENGEPKTFDQVVKECVKWLKDE